MEVRFDLDETWIDNPQARGILLLNVACHEFGHAIGLSHNSVKNNLLNPYYSAAISKPQSEDIRQVVSLYGGPVATPAPGPTPGTPSSGAPLAIKILDPNGVDVWYADKFTKVPRNAMSDESREVF